jgi:HSP20 family protein
MEEAMALVHRDTHVAVWPSFGWPQRWRRLFEFDDGQEWLRVEEFHDGDTLVVRAELPDIDPEMDVEITADDGVVRIKARHEEEKERKQSGAIVPSSATGSSSVKLTYPMARQPRT